MRGWPEIGSMSDLGSGAGAGHPQTRPVAGSTANRSPRSFSMRSCRLRRAVSGTIRPAHRPPARGGVHFRRPSAATSGDWTRRRLQGCLRPGRPFRGRQEPGHSACPRSRPVEHAGVARDWRRVGRWWSWCAPGRWRRSAQPDQNDKRCRIFCEAAISGQESIRCGPLWESRPPALIRGWLFSALAAQVHTHRQVRRGRSRPTHASPAIPDGRSAAGSARSC